MRKETDFRAARRLAHEEVEKLEENRYDNRAY